MFLYREAYRTHFLLKGILCDGLIPIKKVAIGTGIVAPRNVGGKYLSLEGGGAAHPLTKKGDWLNLTGRLRTARGCR